MVARRSFGAGFRFAHAGLVCWRCALKSTPRYKPILQQPLTIVPENRRKYVAQAKSQALSTETVVTQLDSSSKPVKKNKENSTECSRSLQYGTLRESLAYIIKHPKNASSLNLIPHVVARRGSDLSLRRRGRYYTTSASRNAVPDLKATPPFNGNSTLNNLPPAGRNIREHLQLWQQQMESQVDRSSPYTIKAIDHPLTNPRAPQNILTQGTDDNQMIDGDEGEEGDEGDEEHEIPTDSSVYLRRGDVVGIWQNGEPTLGVFVRRFVSQEQIYTMRGRWAHTLPRRIQFVFEQMIQPEDLDIIIPHLPQQEISPQELGQLNAVEVPREAGAKIIQKMLHFDNLTMQVKKEYASRLNRIHEIIAHPTKRSHATLHEIAMKVLKKESREALTDSMLWAVHAALVLNDYCLPLRYSFGTRPMVDIRSRAEAISMEIVRDWVRDYQESTVNHDTGIEEISDTRQLRTRNPIPGFIDKSRALIRKSRETRDAMPSGFLGPSSVRMIPTETKPAVWSSFPLTCFDDDEAKVIRFFHILSTSGTVKGSSMLSTGSTILRAIGMYEDCELGIATGFLLLKELGIIPPWLNREHYSWNLPLPGLHVDPLIDELHIQAKKSVVGFQMEDSMKDFRRDWGDLEAFCIDAAGAREIDDGLSLEEIDECTFWVHIHIANPSAFLAPSSAMGRYAAHSISSLYLPDASYPILPEEITQPFFSLGNNRPCITFSAKLTLTGDVVDTQISHGILRKVRYVTPEDVEHELGFEQEPGDQPMNLTVGGELAAMPARHKPSPLNSSQRRSLHRLHELALARLQKRARETGLGIAATRRCVPTVYFGTQGMGMTKDHLNERTARRFEGDPVISIKRHGNSSSKRRFACSTEEMVGAMMTIAGEIGAMWCSKRNIPIPYRGTARRPNPWESPELFKQKYMDPLIAKQEEPRPTVVLYYLKLLGNMSNSVVPHRHITLNAATYTRATSPLRRFPDLLVHWQIEAAIRQESRTGTSLIGSTDESYLTFSRVEVEELISQMSMREIGISRTERTSVKHWIHQFLIRAFHFKEAPLPEFFNVTIQDGIQRDGGHTGFTTDFRFHFKLLENAATQREGGLRAEDVWEAKIDNIDYYNYSTLAEATRLVERPDVSTGIRIAE